MKIKRFSIKKVAFLAMLFMGGSLMYACKPAEIIDKVEPEKETVSPDIYNISDYAYNVNIVYLVPKDKDTIAGYKERLSELLLWAQNWTKDEMKRHGYDNKTFGLLLNNQNKVLIHVIKSKYTLAELPGATTAAPVRAEGEVNEYFTANPSAKNSDHTLIIYPSETNGTRPVGGTPFYGRGKFSHALDYSLMTLANVKANSILGENVRVWYGGMIHELFHAINLPHNSEKATDGAKALMRYHVGFGFEKSILTATDASIFNVTQVFSKVQGSFYGAVTATAKLTSGSYNAANKTINLAGDVSASNPITKVIVYIDPHTDEEAAVGPSGTSNTDYNAVSFVTDAVNGKFNISIPTNAINLFDTNYDHYIRVSLVHSNGTLSKSVILKSFRYDSNKVPLLSINRTVTELDRSTWSVQSFSSEEPSLNEIAVNVLDGKAETYWQSSWKNVIKAFPHELVLNLGASRTLKGLTWLHRTSTSRRTVSDVEILYSNDNITYTTLGNYKLSPDFDKVFIDFPSTVNARYIKAVMKKGHDNSVHASVAEIGAF